MDLSLSLSLSFSLSLCQPAEANEEIVKVTFGELRRDVALYAAAMRKMGIGIGDRVVGEFHIYFSASQESIERSISLNFQQHQP